METITADILDVAKYVIKWFYNREQPITHLKLQKLLYYIQGWHLALYNKPAFNDEFEAWVHGPVNIKIYQQFKEYRYNNIECPDSIVPNIEDNKFKKHIEEVLLVYGNENAWELEARTHREQPWIEARNNLPVDAPCKNIIKQNTMKTYFASL